MYQPGLDLSVVEIEEGDSILEHLGDVTVGPLCSTPMKVSQVTPTASEDNSHGTLLTTTGSEDDSHGTLPSTAPKRQYVCDESGCTYQTPHAKHLKRHKIVHAPAQHACRFCGKVYRRPENAKMHISAVHEGRSYMCDKCGNKFSSKSGIERHIKVKHNDIHRHTCTTCGQHFEVKNNLLIHIDRHNGIKSHACAKCPANFTCPN